MGDTKIGEKVRETISGKRQNCGPVRSEKTNLWQPLFCPLVISVVGVITCGPGQEGVISLSDLEDSHCSTYSGKRTSLLQHGAWDLRADKEAAGRRQFIFGLLSGRGRMCQQEQRGKVDRLDSPLCCAVYLLQE